MTEDSLRVKLGIKPGQKVSLFHARKDLLGLFIQGDLNLLMDWAEDGCDAILYWLQQKDDTREIFKHLEPLIKARGRIWLILPVKEKAVGLGYKQGWEETRQIILENTSLVDNKALSLGEGEYGTQFVKRKEAKDCLPQSLKVTERKVCYRDMCSSMGPTWIPMP
jgi:hypothetical protein